MPQAENLGLGVTKSVPSGTHQRYGFIPYRLTERSFLFQAYFGRQSD